MTERCYDLYGDLDEFGLEHKLKEKNEDYLKLEKKYTNALKTIEGLQNEIKELKTTIGTISKNFSSLLLTARAELKRKDAQVTALRKEKDDICFRRFNRHQFQEHKPIASSSHPEPRNNEFEQENRDFSSNKKSSSNVFRTKESHSTSNKEISSTSSLFQHNYKRRPEHDKREDSRGYPREERKRRSVHEERAQSSYRSCVDFRRDEMKRSDESDVRKRKHEDKLDENKGKVRSPKKMRRDVNYEDKNGVKMIRIEITENEKQIQSKKENKHDREVRNDPTESRNEERNSKKSISYSEYKSTREKFSVCDLRQRINLSHKRKRNEQVSTIERPKISEQRNYIENQTKNQSDDNRELKKNLKSGAKIQILGSNIEIESEILKDIEVMKQNQETSKDEGTPVASTTQKDTERCSKLIREALEDALFNDDIEFERISIAEETNDKRESSKEPNIGVDIYGDLTMSPVLDVDGEDAVEESENRTEKEPSEIESTWDVTLATENGREKDFTTTENKDKTHVNTVIRSEKQESSAPAFSEKKTVKETAEKTQEVRERSPQILENEKEEPTAKIVACDELKDSVGVHQIESLESEKGEADRTVLEKSVDDHKIERLRGEEVKSNKIVSEKTVEQNIANDSLTPIELMSSKISDDSSRVVNSEMQRQEAHRNSAEINASVVSAEHPTICKKYITKINYGGNVDHFVNHRLLCTETMVDSESSISTMKSTLAVTGHQGNDIEIEENCPEGDALDQVEPEKLTHNLQANVIKTREKTQSTVSPQINEPQVKTSPITVPLDTRIISKEKHLNQDSISNHTQISNSISPSKKSDLNENKRKRTLKKTSSSSNLPNGRSPKMIGHQIEGFEPGWPGQKVLEASKLKNVLFQDVLNHLSVPSNDPETMKVENENKIVSSDLDKLGTNVGNADINEADVSSNSTHSLKSSKITSKLAFQIKKVKFQAIVKLGKEDISLGRTEQKIKKTIAKNESKFGGGVLKRKRGRPRKHPLPNQELENVVTLVNQEREELSERIVDEIDPAEETRRAVDSILFCDRNEIEGNYLDCGNMEKAGEVHDIPGNNDENQEMTEKAKNLMMLGENHVQKENKSVEEFEKEMQREVSFQIYTEELGSEETKRDNHKDNENTENKIISTTESALLNKSDPILGQSVPTQSLPISSPPEDLQSDRESNLKHDNSSSSLEDLQSKTAENDKELDSSKNQRSFNSEQLEKLVKNSNNDDELFDQVFRSPFNQSPSHRRTPTKINRSMSPINTSKEIEYCEIEKDIERMFQNSQTESIKNSSRTSTEIGSTSNKNYEENNKVSLEMSVDSTKHASIANDSRQNDNSNENSEKENISMSHNTFSPSRAMNQSEKYENSCTENFVNNSDGNISSSSLSNKDKRKIFSNSFSDYVIETSDNNVVKVYITRKKKKVKKKK